MKQEEHSPNLPNVFEAKLICVDADQSPDCQELWFIKISNEAMLSLRSKLTIIQMQLKKSIAFVVIVNFFCTSQNRLRLVLKVRRFRPDEIDSLDTSSLSNDTDDKKIGKL